MSLRTAISIAPLSVSAATIRPLRKCRRYALPFATLSSSSPESSPSSTTSDGVLSSKTPPSKSFVESSRPRDSSFNYALADPNGNPVVRIIQSTESNIERAIFDFRFLALLAVGGSLAGSILCFLNGCVYVVDAYKVYWSSCVKGVHTGQMVLRLVEAIGRFLLS